MVLTVAPVERMGYGGQNNDGGLGGGAVILNVANTLAVNGQILADSQSGFNTSGTGGSIFITAGSLSGSGILSANSGTAVWNPGSGGRIAVIASTAGWSGTWRAYGGSGNNSISAAGTSVCEESRVTSALSLLITTSSCRVDVLRTYFSCPRITIPPLIKSSWPTTES